MLTITEKCLKKQKPTQRRPSCKGTCLLWLIINVQTADFTAAHASLRSAKDGDVSAPPSIFYIDISLFANQTKHFFYNFTEEKLSAEVRNRREVLTADTQDGSTLVPLCQCSVGLVRLKGHKTISFNCQST